MGWVVINDILPWTSGCSTVPMKNTFDQIIWWSGCVYWTTIGAMITSTNSIGCWEQNLYEGLRSKLRNYSNHVVFQFWICYNWIQNKNHFRCIVTNNLCWLKGHSCFGNVIIRCHKLPSFHAMVTSLTCWTCLVFCSLNCAFNFRCWHDCWGVKNWPVEGGCGSFLSSCSIGI
jgi:hypothetical protein